MPLIKSSNSSKEIVPPPSVSITIIFYQNNFIINKFYYYLFLRKIKLRMPIVSNAFYAINFTLLSSLRISFIS